MKTILLILIPFIISGCTWSVAYDPKTGGIAIGGTAEKGLAK